MPANTTHQTIYQTTGNPATVNDATQYKAGELGQHQTDTFGATWQRVQLDSGATSATAVGVVAAGQLAYWKDKSAYIVTNDSAQALGANVGGNSEFRNEVAGVFGAAITSGYFCFVQQRGRADVKAASGGTYTVGNSAVANTGTVADCTTVAVGTALTVNQIGIVAGARSAPNAPIDLTIAIPWVP